MNHTSSRIRAHDSLVDELCHFPYTVGQHQWCFVIWLNLHSFPTSTLSLHLSSTNCSLLGRLWPQKRWKCLLPPNSSIWRLGTNFSHCLTHQWISISTHPGLHSNLGWSACIRCKIPRPHKYFSGHSCHWRQPLFCWIYLQGHSVDRKCTDWLQCWWRTWLLHSFDYCRCAGW